MMKKIGIFYGPTGGSTEKVAKKIANALGADNTDLILVKNATAKDLQKYENIIFGISTIGKETWSSESTANDWDIFLPTLDKIDYSGKIIAMFGLGDHIAYPRHFVDALGVLGEKLSKHKAKIVGFCPTKDYEFIESKGVINDKFYGLPIDEDYEEELTNERIKSWLKEIKPEFK